MTLCIWMHAFLEELLLNISRDNTGVHRCAWVTGYASSTFPSLKTCATYGTSSAVQWLRLCASSEGGAWVQSLVGELVSHMVCGVTNPPSPTTQQTSKQKIVPFSFFFFVLRFPVPLATYTAMSSFGLMSCLKPAEYSFFHSRGSELFPSCLRKFFPLRFETFPPFLSFR